MLLYFLIIFNRNLILMPTLIYLHWRQYRYQKSKVRNHSSIPDHDTQNSLVLTNLWSLIGEKGDIQTPLILPPIGSATGSFFISLGNRTPAKENRSYYLWSQVTKHKVSPVGIFFYSWGKSPETQRCDLWSRGNKAPSRSEPLMAAWNNRSATSYFFIICMDSANEYRIHQDEVRKNRWMSRNGIYLIITWKRVNQVPTLGEHLFWDVIQNMKLVTPFCFC